MAGAAAVGVTTAGVSMAGVGIVGGRESRTGSLLTSSMFFFVVFTVIFFLQASRGSWARLVGRRGLY